MIRVTDIKLFPKIGVINCNHDTHDLGAVNPNFRPCPFSRFRITFKQLEQSRNSFLSRKRQKCLFISKELCARHEDRSKRSHKMQISRRFLGKLLSREWKKALTKTPERRMAILGGETCLRGNFSVNVACNSAKMQTHVILEGILGIYRAL